MHVGVSVRPRQRALEVLVAACLKYTSNCSGFGHNAGVNEPRPTIGSGCRGPAGGPVGSALWGGADAMLATSGHDLLLKPR